MIINASKPIDGLNQYIHHFKLTDENNKELPNALYEMNLVQLVYLKIEEDDFDQLMYLFQNNRMWDKIKTDKKIEEAIIMHDRYMKSDEKFAAIQREKDRLALETYKKSQKRRQSWRQSINKNKSLNILLNLLTKKQINLSNDIINLIKNSSVDTVNQFIISIFDIESEEALKKYFK